MHLAGCKLSPKDMVPKAAGDAESVFKILVMVLHVVLLEVVVKGGQPAKLSAEGGGKLCMEEHPRFVMQKVVCQVVTYVAKYTTAKDCGCHVPVPIENGMC